MTAEPGNGGDTVLVWDRPTRVFHWTLVVLVALAWVTSEAEGMLFWTHLVTGYGVMGLVVFRLAWGMIGTRHARFRDFVRPWPAVRAHAGGLLRLSPARALGHTPLGGWMIVALLAVLALLVATGLFSGDEGERGPFVHLVGTGLADALEEVHEGLNTALWSLVAVHIGGVLVESLLERENLVRAMWTGRKRKPALPAPAGTRAGAADATAGDIPPAGALRLGAAVALAAGAVLAATW